MPTPGVKARIDRFWIAIKKLERLSKLEFNEFKSNSDLIDIAERNLQITVEALIDVSEFLISKLNLRTPKSYRDVVRILYEANILDVEEYKFLDKSVILRNIIIHNYVYLKPEILHKYIKEHKRYRGIMHGILKYMEERGIDP